MHAVLFDLDGTLADSHAAIVATTQAALAAEGLPQGDPAVIRGLVGLPLGTIFEGVAPEAAVPALCDAYRARYADIAEPLTTAFPGVPALIADLARAGRPLAITTSKSQAGARRVLRGLGLHSHFDVVLGIDDVAHPKPAPDMARLALSRLGLPPDRAVVVGDTSFDMGMARAAGVRGIGVAWGAHSSERLVGAGAETVVGSVDALRSALEVS